MDKSLHTVTVPREYLETLEDFYNMHKESGFNIHGKVIKVKHPYTRDDEILFLDLNEITDKNFSSIIITDGKGRQESEFRRIF